ncbi:hypothetical protein JOF56_010263 [Kibdelosporangium banguiense]|uniref:Uncharacterized protein n=1 Tax=Kibdelosporangium banguiense TaxID=1365924 RepID=A0ABS4TZP0_9PSEU|nr:hypothetical protein [Kibdelosporangium banguiense]MBP2329878.1 hypothetical protein [Kibdelosporangium banguiense]
MRLLAVLMIFAVLGCAPAPGPDQAPLDPADPASLQSHWWSWAASAPPERDPVSDDSGEFCADRQPEQVWFVAGSFGEPVQRTCDVPAGRKIVGPVINLWAKTDGHCVKFMLEAEDRATLDGIPVPVTTLDAVPISIKGVEGNNITGTGRTMRVQGCGLWFTIPALPEGEHALVISGTSGDFAVDVKYRLIVAAGV